MRIQLEEIDKLSDATSIARAFLVQDLFVVTILSVFGLISAGQNEVPLESSAGTGASTLPSASLRHPAVLMLRSAVGACARSLSWILLCFFGP